MVDLQNEMESVLRDLTWARIDKNGAPYVDNIPQTAQAAIALVLSVYKLNEDDK